MGTKGGAGLAGALGVGVGMAAGGGTGGDEIRIRPAFETNNWRLTLQVSIVQGHVWRGILV